MEKDQANTIAANAVERLASELGLDAKFPFDKIWEYASEEIPSLLRPPRRTFLLQQGYIEETGGKTNAVSKQRAGSPTSEYRLGRRFNTSSPTTQSLTDTACEAVLLRTMVQAMAKRGFIITIDQLVNFYLALRSSPLVILAGTSGTGKSWLPRMFAELTQTRDTFAHISVQPQWADNSDLFGYRSSLAPTTFITGNFTKAIVAAVKQLDKLSIILLDEMNLAPVEYYLSDFLSIVETRRKNNNIISTDPIPLDLPSLPLEGPDIYQELRNLGLPFNLRVVGTANMDETTRSFSPKVLDRAFSIEFGDVNLATFIDVSGITDVDEKILPQLAKYLVSSKNPVSVSEVYADSQELFDLVAGVCEEIKTILQPTGITFGYRTRDAICLYMWHWQKSDLESVLPLNAALDLCILQKILPKISGTGEILRRCLENLEQWLRRDQDTDEVVSVDINSQNKAFRPYLRSADKIKHMIQRLDDGSTSYWGA